MIHGKGNHSLIKLFVAAIFMGLSIHLLFCHSAPFFSSSEAPPITIQKVETNVGLVDLGPQRANTRLVFIDGNHSITFLPVSDLPEILEKASVQVVLVEGNHSTSFLPVSRVPTTSGEEETQPSVLVSQVPLAPQKDEKQERGTSLLLFYFFFFFSFGREFFKYRSRVALSVKEE